MHKRLDALDYGWTLKSWLPPKWREPDSRQFGEQGRAARSNCPRTRAASRSVVRDPKSGCRMKPPPTGAPAVGRRERPTGRRTCTSGSRHPPKQIHAVSTRWPAGREVAARRQPTRAVGACALWARGRPFGGTPRHRRPPCSVAGEGAVGGWRARCQPRGHHAPSSHSRPVGLRGEDHTEPWTATWLVVSRAHDTRGSLWRSHRWLSPWYFPSIGAAAPSSPVRPAPGI